MVIAIAAIAIAVVVRCMTAVRPAIRPMAAVKQPAEQSAVAAIAAMTAPEHSAKAAAMAPVTSATKSAGRRNNRQPKSRNRGNTQCKMSKHDYLRKSVD
jgi:hypothetical protein